MRSRNGIIIIIGFIVLAVLTLALMASLILDYRGRMKNVTDNYVRLGNSLSQTIALTYSFSDSVSLRLDDFIYENMLRELLRSKKDYIMTDLLFFSSNDTVTQGFYFSEKQNKDEYAITLLDGAKAYEIRRAKSDLTGIPAGAGIGRYIQNLEWLSSVEYVAIQDMGGIITATGNVSELASISSDSSLLFAMVEHEPVLRETPFGGERIMEYVHPIENTDKLLRIGFKNADIRRETGLQKRALLAGMLMALLFSSFAFFMFFYYYRALSLSSKVIENERNLSSIFKLTKDPIIIKKNSAVQMNRAAGEILGKDALANEQVKVLLSEKEEKTNERAEIGGRRMLASTMNSAEADETVLILNDITEIEKLREENERKERRSMLGDLSFKIAHELKNPLNGISIIIQRISRRESVTQEEREMLQDAFREIERMNGKITDFMRYAKPGEYKSGICDVLSMVKDAAESLKPLMTEKNLKLSIRGLEGMKGIFDREYMIIAVRNIILNAAEASPDGGRVEVSPSDKGFGIKITDWGDGIPEENMGKIFDLYFTTKQSGSGVGLATAHKIIKENGGDVTVESEKGKGTAVTVNFKER